MGACNFIEFRAAPTAREAFDALVAEAEWSHGHDPYNGTISTTRLMRGGVARVADEWSEGVREKAVVEASSKGWGEKWESRAIDCGSTGEDGLRMWAFYGWASC